MTAYRIHEDRAPLLSQKRSLLLLYYLAILYRVLRESQVFHCCILSSSEWSGLGVLIFHHLFLLLPLPTPARLGIPSEKILVLVMVVKTFLSQRLKKLFAAVGLNCCIVQSIELLLLVGAPFWKSSFSFCKLLFSFHSLD